MKTLTREVFEKSIAKINDLVPYNDDAKQAVVYGVMLDENNDIQFEQVKSAGDVYDLLQSLGTEAYKLKEYDIFTLATCGWAAPIDDANELDKYKDTAPSQHPQKRRVRLLCSGTINDQIGSSIVFSDDIENPMFDYGVASGPLNEALISLINSVKTQ